MSRRWTRAAALLALICASAAQAQDAAKPADNNDIETVTVTGEKQSPFTIVHNFVSTYSVMSQQAGSLTRWTAPICPTTLGLNPQFADIVTNRVRAVAAMIGAKVKDAPCKPNIFIAFTPDPQAMLDAAKTKDPYILGAMGARNNTVTHSIQAWYGTATVDIRGTVIPDDNYAGMTEMPQGKALGSIPMAGIGGAPVAARSGSLIKDGLSSVFNTVFILVDLKKVSAAPLSAIADYAAMLALAQTDSYDTCGPLPSISNLMAAGCSAGKKADALTPSDIGFLRGVYKSAPGAPLDVQQANIASEMMPVLPSGQQ